MRVSRTSVLLLLAAAAILAAAPALAEPSAIEHRLVPHTLSSGPRDNLGGAEAVVFSSVVQVQDAPWLRLTFRRVELGDDSYLRVTSLQDGAVQTLGPRVLAQWRNTSAYFNGSAVLVELVAAPRARGLVVDIGDVYAGVAPTNPESQCGPTDDRVPSDVASRARLLDIGCTASIYTEESCFITAGHCTSTSSLLDTVEFNVPPSLSNGTIQHPGPEDQYAVDVASREFVDGGIGNDWGLFKVFPNSQTNLMPFQAQGERVNLGSTNPPVNDTVTIIGYGVDSGTANQTQQVSSGPITSSSTTTLQYRADTEGGNSGSCVSWDATGDIVAIHTHGGCSTGGGGANSGTAITLNSLQTALSDFCTAGGGDIPCGDIVRLQGVCKLRGTNRTVQAKVTLTNTSHSGQTVEISIDGTPHTATISSRVATFSQGGFSAGQHTVSLTDPAGCVPAVTVTCP
jgi:V8-like Glu-specific endopeptidase